jgi:hypothetical protein
MAPSNFWASMGGQFTGDGQASQGANPTTGDAFLIFDGKVSGLGVLSYVSNVIDSLVLTFTGLNPGKIHISDLLRASKRLRVGSGVPRANF